MSHESDKGTHEHAEKDLLRQGSRSAGKGFLQHHQAGKPETSRTGQKLMLGELDG